MTADQIEDPIEAYMATLANGGALPPVDGGAPSSHVVAMADHSGLGWNQTAEVLKEGFMQKLYGLQGYRGTWYTGGLWCPDFSSNVWAFTDTILPKIVEELA
jgi:hypothetical protein